MSCKSQNVANGKAAKQSKQLQKQPMRQSNCSRQAIAGEAQLNCTLVREGKQLQVLKKKEKNNLWASIRRADSETVVTMKH